MVFPSSWISLLAGMNLSLQVWVWVRNILRALTKGAEGNPLLRPCMNYWGIGVTLIGAKSAACLFLVYLHEVASLAIS